MLLGTVLVLLLLGGGPASAHAALRGADPADGSVVKTAPRSITLTFTESVGLLEDSFRVFDPDNKRVATGSTGHADGRADTARVELPGKLGTGTFTVAWRVVSADSHPIAGAFTFSVGKPSAIPPPLPSTSVENPLTAGLFNIGRYFAYLAAALLIGTSAFAVVCRPPNVRPLGRLLVAGWWALAGSTVFLLLLRGPYETGTGPAKMLDPSELTRTLGTRPGLALVARLALLAVVAVLLLRQRGALRDGKALPERRSRTESATVAVPAVALALTWAAAEHASAGIQVPAAMTSTVLHLLAMAVWLGGLTALLTLFHRASVPSRVVNRFSQVAGIAVTVLVVTGVYQSWRGLGSVSALTDTTYGRVLLAKLAAVTLLLVAGARSRRTVRGERTARSVTVETTGEREAPDRQEARIPEPVGGGARSAADGLAAHTVHGTVRTAGAPSRAATGTGGTGGPEDGSAAGAAPAPADAPTGDTTAGPESGSAADGSAADGPGADAPLPKAARPPAAAPLSPAEDARRRSLRRSVLAEVVVSVVVLVLTTVLTGTLPGRAAAEAATAEQSAGLPVASVTTIPFTIDSDDPAVRGVSGKVQVTLDPGQVGDNGLQAVVYGAGGGFVTVPELRVSFSLPDQDIGPLDAKVTDRGGYWAADAVNLPIAGSWEMKVTVRVSDVDQVSESKPVRIGG
ncbi:copper resistance protein CopC/CopD [Streptomyces sp. MBT49]|uniref:copper resistance CopC/CopD family protein n=1 Tax=Streptomyces sp. MBT49 TaxID=1488380 RepID=UPI00190ADEC9|nr:copper resistance protein CopC [Streptomyces sp. MBT49]MBK3625679.1 copper resistance protein CopC/CopD [Streptomyces sp. MBT49]